MNAMNVYDQYCRYRSFYDRIRHSRVQWICFRKIELKIDLYEKNWKSRQKSYYFRDNQKTFVFIELFMKECESRTKNRNILIEKT